MTTVVTFGADLDAEITAHIAELARHGYRDRVPEPGDRFTVGDRVRHSGQRYAEAYRGTAIVVAVVQVHPRDVEVVVVRDRPICEGMSRVTNWADYSTCESR